MLRKIDSSEEWWLYVNWFISLLCFFLLLLLLLVSFFASICCIYVLFSIVRHVGGACHFAMTASQPSLWHLVADKWIFRTPKPLRVHPKFIPQQGIRSRSNSKSTKNEIRKFRSEIDHHSSEIRALCGDKTCSQNVVAFELASACVQRPNHMFSLCGRWCLRSTQMTCLQTKVTYPHARTHGRTANEWISYECVRQRKILN